MLGITKDIDYLVHLLLGILVQGEQFYNSQKGELIDFFGEDELKKAEELLRGTRIFSILFNC